MDCNLTVTADEYTGIDFYVHFIRVRSCSLAKRSTRRLRENRFTVLDIKAIESTAFNVDIVHLHLINFAYLLYLLTGPRNYFFFGAFKCTVHLFSSATSSVVIHFSSPIVHAYFLFAEIAVCVQFWQQPNLNSGAWP